MQADQTFADGKTECIGAPLNICIDLRKTKCAAILQSVVTMPPAPDPTEDLASILGLAKRQRVDLTALILDISDTRRETTAYGPENIVDITLVDSSTSQGSEKQVSAKMSMLLKLAQRVVRCFRACRRPVSLKHLWRCLA